MPRRSHSKLPDLAFRALHPDCSPVRWTVSGGGINHCSVCCPPPPFGPEQSKRIAKLLVELAYEAARRDQDLDLRWRSQVPEKARQDVGVQDRAVDTHDRGWY